MKKIFASLLVLLTVVFFACDNEETVAGGGPADEEDPVIVNTGTYDAEALLTSWVNNHIIPDYSDFSTLTEELVAAKDAFIAENTEANLTNLRTAYLAAYTYFQRMGLYNVGLADELNYYLFVNVYPTDTEQIESNIGENFTPEDLDSIFEQPTQGFPAMDYLLNGIADSDGEVIEALTADHLDYLSIVVNKIDSLTDAILLDWEGGFDQTFIANSGSDIAGSPNVFYNALIFYFENNLRRQKIDLPAGVFTADTFPDIIESVFDAEQSKGLLLEAFQQFEAFYLGNGQDIPSLSSALNDVGREDLDAVIKEQFTVAETAINALDNNLRSQIETDNGVMLAARDAIQSLVIYFKADVASALGFRITFADNDGD